MKEHRDPVPWRELGQLAAVLCLALILYTLGVALASLDQLLGWLNTHMATVLSVFSALVVGLVLFRFQTKETDAEKREELAALLGAELAELKREFMGSWTTVPDWILEDRLPSAFHEIRLSIHHPHPLVIEEAIRSGLFDAQLTARVLVLARDEGPQSLPAGSDLPGASHGSGLGRRTRAPIWSRGVLEAARRYAQAVRMVRLSEESILAGCGEVLEGLGRKSKR
jgi:hypothetical protein